MLSITEKVVECLLGSSNTVEDACELCNINADELDWDLFDSLIFRCEDCTWWCPIEECNEYNICEDCRD